MTIAPYFELDDFSLDVTVYEDGAAKDLSGATADAIVGKKGANTVVPVSVHDAENGIVRVQWDEDTFKAGVHRLQVRVTLGPETQTVLSEDFTVNPSLRPPE